MGSGSPEESAPGCLQVEDLTVSYNRVPAVHHVSFALAPGSCAALLGPNGAGKTTLLKSIAGLLAVETGQIALGGVSLLRARGVGQRRLIAYVPQRESVDWDFPVTVRGLVEMGRYPALGPFRAFSQADHALVDEALALVQLEDFAERQIRQLSGGQQQRAFLARAWAQQSELYLLDEPFTGLDENARAAFRLALDRLQDAGKIVIASHHDLAEVPEIFNAAVLLNGELIAAGAVADVMQAGNLNTAYSTAVFSGHRTPVEHLG
jgi:ABC-type Mn2+/Zn2+ transport system ATPase subunit